MARPYRRLRASPIAVALAAAGLGAAADVAEAPASPLARLDQTFRRPPRGRLRRRAPEARLPARRLRAAALR